MDQSEGVDPFFCFIYYQNILYCICLRLKDKRRASGYTNGWCPLLFKQTKHEPERDYFFTITV